MNIWIMHNHRKFWEHDWHILCWSPWSLLRWPSRPKSNKLYGNWKLNPVHRHFQSTSLRPPQTSEWIQACSTHCHFDQRITWRINLHTFYKLFCGFWTPENLSSSNLGLLSSCVILFLYVSFLLHCTLHTIGTALFSPTYFAEV